ncbi:natural killer cells antigen CD94 [Ictalurus punctatus]|uniref:Natural killer cells antigen CD94 n=1 Tax=Ictalurus punctatus TaxID=7998 RepID=A0A2D0R5H3_ICTPU|nr:natural killer cells antigen CD94 [Ictalurus punctatus]
MYIKFCNFGPYADVKVSGKAKDESNTDVYQKVRLYKRISAVFIILTLVLLAVVLALAMKLYEVQSIQKYPERPEVEEPEEFNCSRQLCQTMYPSTQDVQKHVYRCTMCPKGWLKFENSCYFISKERLTWQESREACQKQDGDLVVIDNERVQKHLTQSGGMLYWIGLRYSEKQQWMWINNTAPTQNYWAHGQPVPDSQGSCALLGGQMSHKNNWISNRCGVLSQYICQRG